MGFRPLSINDNSLLVPMNTKEEEGEFHSNFKEHLLIRHLSLLSTFTLAT